jgi:hypothetical protein
MLFEISDDSSAVLGKCCGQAAVDLLPGVVAPGKNIVLDLAFPPSTT